MTALEVNTEAIATKAVQAGGSGLVMLTRTGAGWIARVHLGHANRRNERTGQGRTADLAVALLARSLGLDVVVDRAPRR